MVGKLEVSRLVIKKTNNPKKKLPIDQLVFGKTFTDHMLKIRWTLKTGWENPEIIPYSNLNLDPSAVVFHYAFELFEGMKAYKSLNSLDKGAIKLFRPNMNMKRMNKSASRIALPTFDGDELTKLISEFVKIEKDWIPEGKGYSLYLRPTLIGTTPMLGVGAPDEALLYVIASPVGPYYKTGFKAVELEATDYAVRAWPGGVGDKKLGANYAPCIVPQLEAAKRGFQQNLWLFGPEKNITEVGTMNFFVVLHDPKTGLNELTTAPLDGTILEGVTRDSILSLARERLDKSKWKISERYTTITELENAAQQGNLLEAFGAGTAAIVSPIKSIDYHGKTIKVPLAEGKQTGELTEKFANWISDIQYGITPNSWSYNV